MVRILEEITTRNLQAKYLLKFLFKSIHPGTMGAVAWAFDGIISIRGMYAASLGEAILLPQKMLHGVVLELRDDNVMVAYFGAEDAIGLGDMTIPTGHALAISVGRNAMGNAVNCLGIPLLAFNLFRNLWGCGWGSIHFTKLFKKKDV